jgi:hypothetical protein
VYDVDSSVNCANPDFPIPEKCKIFYSFYECNVGSKQHPSVAYRHADAILSGCTRPNNSMINSMINSEHVSRLLENVHLLLEQNPPQNEFEREALFSYKWQMDFIKGTHCRQ